jgi:nicotinate-nucleotide adenylyltransferase
MIAIYGGAFDPIHVGHLSVVCSTLYYHDIDELIILPSYKHPYGKDMVSIDTRISWIQRLIDINETLSLPKNLIERITVSDIERKLFDDNKPVYTIDVLKHFQKLYPKKEIAFISGEDNDMTKYKGFSYIKENFKIIEAKLILKNCHSSIIKRSGIDIYEKFIPKEIISDVFFHYSS